MGISEVFRSPRDSPWTMHIPSDTYLRGSALPSHPALALGRVRHGLAKQGIHLPSDNTPSDGNTRPTEIHPARALGCVRHGLDKQ